MHAIVFPFIIYTILGILVLLVWPQRGLNGRNYMLLISSAMGSLAIGVGLAFMTQNYVNIVARIYFMLVCLPAVSALLIVSFFGSEGFTLASKRSVLYRCPHIVFYSACIAFVLGALISLPIAYLGLSVHYLDQIVFTSLIVITIAGICTFLLSGFIKNPTLALSFKVSIASSLIALFFSFVLGPYFLFALPIVIFVLVATFTFVYILFKFDRNLTS